MRTATSRCRSTAPSSRGAASRTGPPTTSRRSGDPGTVLVDDRGELVELLTDPLRRGAAAALARRDGALHGEDVAHAGGQRRRDLAELLVGEVGELDAELLAAPDAGARDLVRDPERHALAHQPL